MKFTIQAAAPKDLPLAASLYGAVCDSLAGKPYNPGWTREGFPTVENAEKYQQEGLLLLAMDGSAVAGSVGLTPNPSAEADESQPRPLMGRPRTGCGTFMCWPCTRTTSVRGSAPSCWPLPESGPARRGCGPYGSMCGSTTPPPSAPMKRPGSPACKRTRTSAWQNSAWNASGSWRSF